MPFCAPYILQQLYGAMIGSGIYYMTWVLKNKNLRGYIIAVIGRALVVVAGYMGSIPLMLAFTAIAALDMMQFMYLWLPLIFDVLIMIVLSRMNVEAVNEKLKAEKGIKSDEVTDATEY